MSNSKPPQPDITRTIREILSGIKYDHRQFANGDEWNDITGVDEAVQKLVTLMESETNKLYALTEVERYDGLSKQQKKILLDYHSRAVEELSQ